MQFLALDCWNGSLAQALGFVSNTGITYPLLRSAGGVTNLYAGGYEYVYVVGTDGKVVYRNLSGWNTNQVRDAVDTALAATAAPPQRELTVRLSAPYPNPFNPRTSLLLQAPVGAEALTLEVFDARGRLVRTLLRNESVAAGDRVLRFDGLDDAGRSLASGVYHFRLSAGSEVIHRKGVLVQ